MEKEAILYEIGYLLNPNLKDEEILYFTDKLKTIISEKNGLVESEGKSKKQALAYPVKKETSAIFNWIKFAATPSAIEEISEYFKKHPAVLRFLVIKTKKEEPPRPVILRPKIRKTEETAAAAAVSGQEEVKEKIQEAEIDKKIEELLGDN